MSLLDQISQQVEIYREDWRNGKKGAICDIKCNGVFRFIEMYRGENGMLNYRNPNHENDPIVCVGIAAHWLIHRKSASNILLKLTPKGTTQKFGEGVRQMYENYTEMRFNQFKDMLNDNADTWDWEEDDWKKYFFLFIIQKEKHLNEMSEPLFDYISESDAQKIRPVMENYIKYLEKCRDKILALQEDEIIRRLVPYKRKRL